MNSITPVLLLTIVCAMFAPAILSAQETETQAEPVVEADHLVILWTSGDPEVAEKMLLMYSHAAQHYGWFKQVTIIIWGPSARLVAAHKDIQEKIKEMQKAGVIFEACIACAGQYGVVEALEALDIDVKGMGGPLSEYIKSDAHIITI